MCHLKSHTSSGVSILRDTLLALPSAPHCYHENHCHHHHQPPTSSTVLVTAAVTMVTSCDGILGDARVQCSMSVYHVCVSVCYSKIMHLNTEDDVNQWRMNGMWSELTTVCCPGCFQHSFLISTIFYHAYLKLQRLIVIHQVVPLFTTTTCTMHIYCTYNYTATMHIQ